jgi:diguanylate cyclase (GGDEF)-like protein
VVELATGAPFAVFGEATGSDGLLRFLPAPAPAAEDVVPVTTLDRPEPLPDGARNRFLAVTLPSLARLDELSELAPDFLVLGPDVTDGRTRAIADAEVAAIIAYARARAVEAVALGIADQAHYDRLRHLGVRYGAGTHVDQHLCQELALAPAHRPQDRTAWLRARLAPLDTAADVAAAVCDHVRALGLLPSVYVERHGLLRCIAQRGYWQIMDGIPIDAGVLGRTFRHGRREHVDASADPTFIEAVPGLVAEITTPIAIDGRVRAVFSVEHTCSFRPAERHEVERVADELERALQRVGLDEPVTALHSLVRANAELVAASDAETVAHTAVRVACGVAGVSSAMIAFPVHGGDTAVRAACGPLAPALRRLDGDDIGALIEHLGGISSCISGGDEAGHVHPVFHDLRRSGGTSIGVFPVRCGSLEPGLLFAADQAPGGLGGEQREAMELLAAAIARTLDHVRTHAALRYRAERDSLTGVGNRGSFDEALLRHDTPDGRERRVAILVIDIDRFKQVNDQHGHVAGDSVLVDTARAMADCLREVDHLFRIGGDEFAIVVPDIDEGTAAELAGRMIERCGPHLEAVGAGVSVGVAVRLPGEPMTDCFVRADRNLYEAKAAHLPG